MFGPWVAARSAHTWIRQSTEIKELKTENIV